MYKRLSGPSLFGWALLLLVLAVAALLRFWNLGQAPPGLYRDEAYNGLDALNVLKGRHALFFTTNNGREPAYIYLTSLAIALAGRTVIAVRLAAAAVGTLNTLFVYGLARRWFDRRTAIFAAWLWAVTLWPIHLSRIGLRPILLAPLLASTFWLGTEAFRRRNAWLWLASGAVYGAAFYTYLAARFTPLLLALLLSYLLLTRPTTRHRLWPGVLLFVAGALVVVLPLGLYAWRTPELFLGRAHQVSIFSSEINQGDFLGALFTHIGKTLAMFFWRGDTILRHNPAGRPVFDLYMAVPFLIGFIWSLRRWQRLSVVTLVLWLTVMLGPTIFAEDAPHFLRASGILPAILFLPALGLSKLWEWPKLPRALRRGLVLLLAFGTLISTVRDYGEYVRQPDTAYLFEAAARELAEAINDERAEVTVYVDRRFWEGWSTLPYLVQCPEQVQLFTPEQGLPEEIVPPTAIYAWPYARLDFIPAVLKAPVVVSIREGGLARGDLEPEPYPLYIRYGALKQPMTGVVARFGEQVTLRDATTSLLSPDRLQVDLFWSVEETVASPLVTFVHIRNDHEIVDQNDALLGQGYWPLTAWRAGQVVHEWHVIELEEPYDFKNHQIVVGLYDATTLVRLPVQSPVGQSIGDTWLLDMGSHAHEE